MYSATLVIMFSNLFVLIQALFDHMHAEAAAGRALMWSPIAQAPPITSIIGSVALIVMVVAIAGSIYFFFECRTRNMKAEDAAKVEPSAAPAT